MKSNNRTPIRIGKNFKHELEVLQAKLMIKKGIRYSLSELSDLITTTPSFKNIERDLSEVNNFFLKIEDRKKR